MQLLTDCWTVLQAISREILGRVPSDTAVQTVGKLQQYAVSLPKQEVISAFVTGVSGLTRSAARAALGFLTFQRARSDEIWARPLVPTGADSVIPIIGAILYGNLVRTTQLWMRAGGLDLASRGPAFEAYVRKLLAGAIREGRLSDAGVYPTAFTIPDQQEEIDVVLWIKDRLFIGEAKCLLFPANPIEIHDYLHTTEKAAGQAQRKAAAMQQHKATVRELLSEKGYRHQVDMVHPFVLVNQPFAVGIIHAGVPVVDLLILERYLSEGRTESFVRFEAMDGKRIGGQVEELYADDDGAAERLDSYLRDPPQLRRLRQGVSLEYRPDLRLHDDDLPVAVGHFAVCYPMSDAQLAGAGVQRVQDDTGGHGTGRGT